MAFLADVPVLHGSLVRLEPLSVGHGADLAVAARYGIILLTGDPAPRPA
jgi:hypothetical protein